jgi:FkbH-like protein
VNQIEDPSLDRLRALTLVRSRFAQELWLRDDLWVVTNALVAKRLTVRREVKDVLDAFASPTPVGEWVEAASKQIGKTAPALLRAVADLYAANLLFDVAAGDEAEIARRILGSQVVTAHEAIAPLRSHGERNFAWTLDLAKDIDAGQAPPPRHHLKVVFMGACEVQLQMDLFRELAASEGIHVDAYATAATDFAFLAETQPDAVFLGGGEVISRLFRFPREDGGGAGAPAAGAVGLGRELPRSLGPEQVRLLLRQVLAACRRATSCPILLHNVPVPTSTPLGIADRGRDSFVNLAREIDLVIADVAAEVEDVFVVDLENLYGLYGKRRLLDDSISLWGHLGSLTAFRDYWMPSVGRPELHALDPAALLGELGPSEKLELERLLAREQLDLLRAIRGIGRRKVVIVDLDNTLWPGVLAETESPFGGGALNHGRIDLSPWLGIHEALRALQHRGFLLACCSKNDEAVVRKYWRYPERSASFLLGLDDFVTHRIDWNEKVEHIQSIVAELDLGIDSAVFIDDNPVERDKVRRYLPEVLVLGDNLFTVRSRLLLGPEFQVPAVTAESRNRTRMMKEQVGRRRAREQSVDGTDYVRSLEVQVEVGRVADPALLDRLAELVQRTNQFNTTGIRFSKDQLRAMLPRERDTALGGAGAGDPEHTLFAMRVADRFGDHGLVGACVMRGSDVELFVMSCRVIGLGVERILLGRAVDAALERSPGAVATATFRPTDRNTPARHLFRDCGFEAASGGGGEGEGGDGASRWVFDPQRLAGEGKAPPWRQAETLYRITPLEPTGERVAAE